MCALAEAATEYWTSLGGLASRVLEDENRPPSPTLIRRYAHLEPDSPAFSFDGSSLRAYFRTENFWRSPSQQELALEGEPAPVLEPQQLRHQWKLVNELKGALRPDVKFQPPPTRPTHPAPPPPVNIPPSNESIDQPDVGFIAKLIGNKKSKTGNSEERELLVSPEKRCQIVASSDNFFKTDFGSSSRPLKDTNVSNNKGLANYKSISGLEEARALLSGSGLQDSFNTSADSDFHSCDDTTNSVTSPSSSTLILPKTGYDFLDNW